LDLSGNSPPDTSILSADDPRATSRARILAAAEARFEAQSVQLEISPKTKKRASDKAERLNSKAERLNSKAERSNNENKAKRWRERGAKFEAQSKIVGGALAIADDKTTTVKLDRDAFIVDDTMAANGMLISNPTPLVDYDEQKEQGALALKSSSNTDRAAGVKIGFTANVVNGRFEVRAHLTEAKRVEERIGLGPDQTPAALVEPHEQGHIDIGGRVAHAVERFADETFQVSKLSQLEIAELETLLSGIANSVSRKADAYLETETTPRLSSATGDKIARAEQLLKEDNFDLERVVRTALVDVVRERSAELARFYHAD
jgi:hypothetical protein